MIYTKTIIHLSVREEWWIFTSTSGNNCWIFETGITLVSITFNQITVVVYVEQKTLRKRRSEICCQRCQFSNILTLILMLYVCMAVSPLKVRFIGWFMQVIVGTLRCIRNCSVSFSIVSEDVKREGLVVLKLDRKNFYLAFYFSLTKGL